MSTEPIRCRRRVLVAIFATGVLISCGPAPQPDPVDQARAALQKEFGADYELHSVEVEAAGGHNAVCGLGAQTKPPGQAIPMPVTAFVVIDGRIVDAVPPEHAELVSKCRDSLPPALPPVY